MTFSRRRVVTGLAAVCAAALAGCGGPHEYPVPDNLYPVRGTIRVGGQPLTGGLLSCVLVTDTDRYGPAEAPAEVRPDGTFEPVLFNGHPGLYPGRWKVVVKSTAAYRDGKKVAARQPIPARFMKEETSDLFIDVTAGENTPALVIR